MNTRRPFFNLYSVTSISHFSFLNSDMNCLPKLLPAVKSPDFRVRTTFFLRVTDWMPMMRMIRRIRLAP